MGREKRVSLPYLEEGWMETVYLFWEQHSGRLTVLRKRPVLERLEAKLELMAVGHSILFRPLGHSDLQQVRLVRDLV
jgi:hypothetical protein